MARQPPRSQRNPAQRPHFRDRDAKEGPRAFAEKRPPKWRARGTFSVEAVEALRIQPADFRAGCFADVRARAQVLGALGPFAVPVRVVAGEHDEVVAEHINDAGQDGLLRLAGHEDVASTHVLLRIALPATLD